MRHTAHATKGLATTYTFVSTLGTVQIVQQFWNVNEPARTSIWLPDYC